MGRIPNSQIIGLILGMRDGVKSLLDPFRHQINMDMEKPWMKINQSAPSQHPKPLAAKAKDLPLASTFNFFPRKNACSNVCQRATV